MALSVYIVHSTHTAPTRGEAVDTLVKIFKSADEKTETIDGLEVEDINSKDLVNRYVSYADDKTFPPHMAPDMDAYRSLRTNLHLRQLSCALKHTEALRRISELPDDRVGVVLEDDVQYARKSVVDLVRSAAIKLRQDCKDGCGVAFLGCPMSANDAASKPEFVDDDGMWFVDMFKTFRYFPPSVESYIVTPKAARMLCSEILPIRFMFHVHMGYTLQKLSQKMSAFVLRPNIFMDGSKAGAHVSSLLPQAHLIYNNEYMTVWQAIAGPREADAKACLAILDSSPIAHHPAMLHLRGKVHAALLGDLKEARKYLEQAYEDITVQDTYISSETQILKDLIRTYAPAWERPFSSTK